MATDEKNPFHNQESISSWTQLISLGHKYVEKPAIDSILPSIIRSTLCVCSGKGDEWKELLKRGADLITVVDSSAEMLKHARLNAPQAIFEKADMSALPFDDKSFNLLFSSLTLHYAPDWDVVPKECETPPYQ